MKSATEVTFHPQNRHQGSYDFEKLAASHPPLRAFLISKPEEGYLINFADPAAVLALNTAILSHDYRIRNWSIPDGYLCPPVPGRADYLHHLRDLLDKASGAHEKPVRVMDIGTGAGAIYALLGASLFGWTMVASDIDTEALEDSRSILKQNPSLEPCVELRLQENPEQILRGIIQDDECFDACLCNPPFFESEASADLANTKKQEKHRKLGIPYSQDERTFAGRPNERYCEGGERGFIERLVAEGIDYKHRFRWFTTLVSREGTLEFIRQKLKAAGVSEQKVIPMRHGNKFSRILAWSYGS